MDDRIHRQSGSFVLLAIALAGCGCSSPVRQPLAVGDAKITYAYASIGHPNRLPPDDVLGLEHALAIEKIPRGKIPAGFVPLSALDGKKHFAVIGRQNSANFMRHTGSNRGKAERNQTTKILVFSKNWRLVGTIRGLPREFERTVDPTAILKWNHDESLLGVMYFYGAKQHQVMDIGVVDPKSLRLQVISHIGGVEDAVLEGWLWNGKQIVAFCHVASGGVAVNAIYVSDIDSHHTRLLYKDANPFAPSIEDMALSPNGTHVAFDRDGTTKYATGIWLLNLKTGKCIEVTHENAGFYYHYLGCWLAPNKLLFTSNGAGVYQLTFKAMP